MFAWLRARGKRPVVTAPEAPPEPPAGPLSLYRAGRYESAQAAAEQALAELADGREALLVQALLALDRQQSRDALRMLERLATLDPSNAEVHAALGRAAASCGRKSDATAAWRRALELDPQCVAALLPLGQQALAARRHDEALDRLTAVVSLERGRADAQVQVGDLLRERNRDEEAAQHYRHAVDAQPDLAPALQALGDLARKAGRLDEAASWFERALAAQPGSAAAARSLGMVRVDQRRWPEAAAALRVAVQAEPKQFDLQYWLGNAAMGSGDAATAREAYKAALRLNAGHVQSRWGHAMAQLPAVPADAAEAAGAAAAFAGEVDKLRSWLRVRLPDDAWRAVGAQQPYYIAYRDGNHRDVLAEYGRLCVSLMGAWARKNSLPKPAMASGTKCRVGIVSGHVHSHSVWNAIVRGWIEHLDPARFELQIFYTGAVQDAETEWAGRRVARLHRGAGEWQAWARTIADARVDALIYPEIGMDATTQRLASLRLARVQLASWGHPLTTGLPTIDGFVSADGMEPADADNHYTERLLRLPGLGCCYRPFGTRPASIDLVGFGVQPGDRLLLCPGMPFKYAPSDDTLLVEVARRCRPCKLLFFAASPRALSERFERRLRAAFDAAGVPFDDCVRFVPWQAQAVFFGLLDRCEAMLDSPGFSGFNTTMQAVERGAPVVAWEGPYLRSRFASGILRTMGLDDWVADTAEAFAERVERIAADRSARSTMRAAAAKHRSTLFEDRRSVLALAEHLLALAAQGAG